MADLILENLSIDYGSVRAVDDVSIVVPSGQFLTLLGPSGCGKSTTLFAIAGLNHASSGVIRLGDQLFFDGASSTNMPTEKRNVGLVFQSYALWPHKTVAENLAFPLQLRRVGKSDRERAIRDALGLVEMEKFAERYPFELSGGQQQRVALARALVYKPSVLLLDEPLSNLDAKLRERARVWLRDLQERLGVTTIYVTHDQAEALAVSDQIAVMEGGRVRQIGSPTEIYDNPSDTFVADFIGSSNFLPGRVVDRAQDYAIVRLDDGSMIRATLPPDGLTDVKVSVRPEKIRLVDAPGQNVLTAHVGTVSYLGSVYQYDLTSGGMHFRVQTSHAITTPEVFALVPEDATILFADQA